MYAAYMSALHMAPYENEITSWCSLQIRVDRNANLYSGSGSDPISTHIASTSSALICFQLDLFAWTLILWGSESDIQVRTMFWDPKKIFKRFSGYCWNVLPLVNNIVSSQPQKQKFLRKVAKVQWAELGLHGKLTRYCSWAPFTATNTKQPAFENNQKHII